MEQMRYMISDAANAVAVESHVLRYWEDELELSVPRNEMGHRYYTKENIEQFRQIKELKEKGYQLKAIKILIHNSSEQPIPSPHVMNEKAAMLEESLHQKQKEEQKRIYEEHRRKQEEYINSLAPPARNNLEFDLLPKNVINYLGKVTRDEFEKLVGPALDDEEGFIVYKVKNKYDEVVTALRCYYRESDSKLISIKFPTPHYLGYWIDFTTIEGYPKTEAVAKKNGNYLPKRDQFNRLYQINLKTKSFGCQIMDIKEYSNYSTAVINYHIVK